MMTAKFPPVDIRGAMAEQEVEPHEHRTGNADVDKLADMLKDAKGYNGPIVMWGLGGRHQRHKDGSVTFTPFSEMTEEDMP